MMKKVVSLCLSLVMLLSVAGGIKANDTKSDTVKVTLVVARYSQVDDRWDDKPLGVCPAGTLANAGAALVSVTMVYNHLSGENINPEVMNEKIMGNSCAMVWGDAAKQLGITYVGRGETNNEEVHGLVKEQIDSDLPVILRLERELETHYVVANGYDIKNETVAIKNPSVLEYTQLSQFLNEGWMVT